MKSGDSVDCLGMHDRQYKELSNILHKQEKRKREDYEFYDEE